MHLHMVSIEKKIRSYENNGHGYSHFAAQKIMGVENDGRSMDRGHTARDCSKEITPFFS